MICYSYGKEYYGDKITPKITAENANSRRTNTFSSLATRFKYCTGFRACDLFSAYRFSHREGRSDSVNRNLFTSVVRTLT